MVKVVSLGNEGEEDSIFKTDIVAVSSKYSPLISKEKLDFLYKISDKEQDFVVGMNHTIRQFRANEAYLNALGREAAKLNVRLEHSHSKPNCEQLFGNWGGKNNKSPNAGLNEFCAEAILAMIDKARNWKE